MGRGGERTWSVGELIAAYRGQPGPIGGRVEALLQSVVALGRLITIKTQGPAFGIVSRDMHRVLSIREHTVTARRGEISYFPLKADASQAPEDRSGFDSRLTTLGFQIPPASVSPGHRVLGTLDAMNDQQFQEFLDMVESLGPLPASDIGEPSPAQRRTVVSNRVVRDSSIARALKARYSNSCQICGSRLSDPTGEWAYSEGHHLRPLGAPHNGSDSEDNILVVCPNHHAMLDFAVLPLKSTTLRISKHSLNAASVTYHNDMCARRAS